MCSTPSINFATFGNPIHFTDMPLKRDLMGLLRFTADNFREIFNLMKDVSEISQEGVIKKFEACPKISKRCFQIRWDRATARQRKELFPEVYSSPDPLETESGSFFN